MVGVGAGSFFQIQQHLNHLLNLLLVGLAVARDSQLGLGGAELPDGKVGLHGRQREQPGGQHRQRDVQRQQRALPGGYGFHWRHQGQAARHNAERVSHQAQQANGLAHRQHPQQPTGEPCKQVQGTHPVDGPATGVKASRTNGQTVHRNCCKHQCARTARALLRHAPDLPRRRRIAQSGHSKTEYG